MSRKERGRKAAKSFEFLRGKNSPRQAVSLRDGEVVLARKVRQVGALERGNAGLAKAKDPEIHPQRGSRGFLGERMRGKETKGEALFLALTERRPGKP